MLQLQAFRYQLRPNGEQERSLWRFAGSRRFAYNRALALQKDRRAKGEKKLGYAALCKELTAWRGSEETPWLADAPIHPLQASAKGSGSRIYQLLRGPGRVPRRPVGISGRLGEDVKYSLVGSAQNRECRAAANILAP